MAEQNSSNIKRQSLGRLFQTISQRLKRSPMAPGVMPVSSRLATWVGIFSASVGGFLGLDTYRADVSKKVDQSVEKSFEMIYRFNEPQLAGPRERVLSYVLARRYCDSRYISRDLTDTDYVIVLDYFDLTHACVDAGLCDEETARQFFSPYANHQWPILKSSVELLRHEEQSMRADSGFGEGMKAFATNPTVAPPCDGNF